LDTGNEEHTIITPTLGADSDTRNLRFYIPNISFN